MSDDFDPHEAFKLLQKGWERRITREANERMLKPNVSDVLRSMETAISGLEKIAEAMKNDDGNRVAFVYIGRKEYPGPEMGYSDIAALRKSGTDMFQYDNRQWAMVDASDGQGSRLMLISEALPDIEFARKHGYTEDKYKAVGTTNIYTDKLGYYSKRNALDNPALTGDALRKAVDAWYLSSPADDKNIIADAREDTLKSAKAYRQHLTQIKTRLN